VIFYRPLLHYQFFNFHCCYTTCIFILYTLYAVCPGKLTWQFRKARRLWSGPYQLETSTNWRDVEMCLLAASTMSTSDYLALCHSYPLVVRYWWLGLSLQCNWPKFGVVIMTKRSIKPGMQEKFTLCRGMHNVFKSHWYGSDKGDEAAINLSN
jgi:hypothetical protein